MIENDAFDNKNRRLKIKKLFVFNIHYKEFIPTSKSFYLG